MPWLLGSPGQSQLGSAITTCSLRFCVTFALGSLMSDEQADEQLGRQSGALGVRSHPTHFPGGRGFWPESGTVQRQRAGGVKSYIGLDRTKEEGHGGKSFED